MAYAAVISLKHTIERLQMLEFSNIDQPLFTESAYDRLEFIQSTLKKLDDSRHINIDRRWINLLEEEMSEAAYKFEDALEFYALNHSEYDWTMLEQESISFFTTMDEFVEDYLIVLDSPLPLEDGEDLGGDESNEAVGLSGLVEDISEKLVHNGPLYFFESRTTWIVGMAGIGKTRLAREIYRHPVINKHYRYTVWVRIGQHPDEKRILNDVVEQIEIQARNDDNVVAQGERCLIVLDDVWSNKVVEYLDELLVGERWRFLVTTRLEDVNPWHGRNSFRVPFLDEEQSWSLLKQIVFVDHDETISSRLEEVGRRIADGCEGLPLLILTVANILRVQDISEEYWKKVADKKTTTFPDAFEQIYDVLILSYDYLLQYLKALFLYMGVFPQSFVIPFTKLRTLMVAEAFSEHVTLTGYFEWWLIDLVKNSIVIVCKRSCDASINSCKLHSAYWYLCVKEARKVKFFHALNKLADVKHIERRPRRLSFQNNVLFGLKEVYDSMAADTLSITRSLLCTGAYHQYPVRVCFNMILLKVLDALAIRFYEFPCEILINLLQLRYLALTHDGEVPSSISNLGKMQYLILRQHHHIRLLRHSRYMPREIWDMKELKRLQIMGCTLPDPPEGLVLSNLKSLHVNAASCTENVFKGISSRVKKLRITIELEPDPAGTLICFEHISHLLKLESLKCVVVNPARLRSQVTVPPDHLWNIPERLRKLSLNGLGYSWKDISIIGLLPHLQVLKLRCNAFQGPDWESSPEEFKSLEALVLEDMDLVHWTIRDASQETFPSLHRIILRHCYKLKEIPITKRIFLELVDCSPSLVAYGEQQEENFFEVMITSSWNFH